MNNFNECYNIIKEKKYQNLVAHSCHHAHTHLRDKLNG